MTKRKAYAIMTPVTGEDERISRMTRQTHRGRRGRRPCGVEDSDVPEQLKSGMQMDIGPSSSALAREP
ncbi:hypothetical protein [Ktedonospora formicarum]|uniref:hypothetical protein n=1 Tax=Ktedonospora formicarum TaxID=2778364 RepID=UPI001C68C0F9|nr:hypothetical protein [Ktedonospora formicarum]